MNPRKPLQLVLLFALMVSGCAGAKEITPADEVRAFFVAGREATFQGVMCLSPHHVDLSAYDSFAGVKYPPTTSVEVLSGPPSRPYEAFARLQGPASSSATVPPETLAQLTTKARAIGGDAIILCQQPGDPSPPVTGRPARVEAVAIKYRWENPQEKARRP
jgi:hypothetical protein